MDNEKLYSVFVGGDEPILYFAKQSNFLSGSQLVVDDVIKKVESGQYSISDCIALDGAEPSNNQCWRYSVIFNCTDLNWDVSTEETTQCN